ncbi:MAG: hypothetical protein WAO98_08195 [Alphaproteobacteria bacterium]
MFKSLPGGVAAAVLVTTAPSIAIAQDQNPAPSTSYPQISGNHFGLLFFEHPDDGFGKGVSVSPTYIMTTNIDFSGSVRLQAALRTDWFNRRPGVLKSQYVGIKDLNLQEKFGDVTLQQGTIGFWGPTSATTIFKQSQWTRQFVGFGGPGPGLIGARADGVHKANGLTTSYAAFVGTGDRGLTGSLADNRDVFKSLCQSNDRACGVVAGAQLHFQSEALPGAGLHFQATSVGNGGSLRDELRTTVGVDYAGAVTSRLSVDASAEYTHGTNYRGGARDLDMFHSTVGVTAKVNDQFSLRPYASVTDLTGAVNETYAIVSNVLTYKTKSGDVFTAEVYGGRPKQRGVIFSISHNF